MHLRLVKGLGQGETSAQALPKAVVLLSQCRIVAWGYGEKASSAPPRLSLVAFALLATIG